MRGRESEGRGGEGGLGLMRTSAFVLFAIWVKYMFTRLQMRNPGAPCQFSYSPHQWQPSLLPRPPLGSDFCNSYLDEWLKLRHSRQESHYPYLRKTGRVVMFWCIALHPACKRDTLTPPMPPNPNPFLSDGSPMTCLLWLIRCCRGITGDLWEICLPTHPAG